MWHASPSREFYLHCSNTSSNTKSTVDSRLGEACYTDRPKHLTNLHDQQQEISRDFWPPLGLRPLPRMGKCLCCARYQLLACCRQYEYN